jgi:DNA-directed RNA polymerase III subunit RPC11
VCIFQLRIQHLDTILTICVNSFGCICDSKMWFCPLDGTLLQVQTPANNTGSTSASSNSIFICSTCPFSCDIRHNFTNTTKLDRKEVDDILGGAAAWENVDKTAAVCPSCSYHEAYFMQMQIRSADEPMSVFYKCVKCSNQWNDK